MSLVATIAKFAEGEVTDDLLSWTTQPIRPLEEGEVLVRHSFVSIDPTHRIYLAGKESYVPAFKIGDQVLAAAVGTVQESRAEGFKPGDKVADVSTIASHAIKPAGALTKIPAEADFDDYLTLFNPIIGLTAGLGVDICDVTKPVKGDRHCFVVSAAAGAVGSVAGQLAKARGAYTIGIAGGPEKCALLRELGFDAAIDYKAYETEDALKEAIRDAAAPAGGVDSHFDNVGGTVAAAVLENFKLGGRIALCGAISGYNSTEDGRLGFHAWSSILFKRATVKGFICIDSIDQAPRIYAELASLAAAGKLKAPRLDVGEGLQSALGQVRKLTSGKNTGKTCVRVLDSDIPSV